MVRMSAIILCERALSEYETQVNIKLNISQGIGMGDNCRKFIDIASTNKAIDKKHEESCYARERKVLA